MNAPSALPDMFPEIWAGLTTQGLMALLDAHKPRPHGQYVAFSCPNCGQPEAYIYEPKDGKGPRLHCNRRNSCGYKVPLWDYVKQQHGEDGKAALAALAGAAGVRLREYAPPTPRASARARSHSAFELSRAADPQAPPIPTGQAERHAAYQAALAGSAAERYLRARGVFLADALAMGFGYCRDWPDEGRARLAYPLRDKSGQVIALEGRLLPDQRGPKCMLEKGAKKGAGLFMPSGCFDPDALHVCEGPFDAIALGVLGINAVATCGADNYPEWLVRACGFRAVVCAFDADKAGEEAYGRMQETCSRSGSPVKRLRPPEDGKDWGAYLSGGAEELRALYESVSSDPLPARRIGPADLPKIDASKAGGLGLMPLSDFAVSRRTIPVFSQVLQKKIILAANNAIVSPGEDQPTVYRAREIEALADASPDDLRFLDEIKSVFGGEVMLDDDLPEQVRAAMVGDLFTEALPLAVVADPVAADPFLEPTPDQQAEAAALDQQHPASSLDQRPAPPARRPNGGKKHWPTAYIDTRTGQGVADDGGPIQLGERPRLAAILAFALTTGTKKIFLCGPVPGAAGSAPTKQGEFEAWALAGGVSDEWQDGDGKGKASVLGNVQSAGAQSEQYPVIRKQHRETRHTCSLYRMAAWFSEGSYSPAEARQAMGELAGALSRHFGEAVKLTATPAHTGLELWRISTRGQDFPTLPDDVQRLINNTAGQGRIELCTLPDAPPIREFVYLDARFAYAASLTNLPAGLAVHDDRPDFEPHTRGRYRVRYQVPADWKHLGLFMTPAADSRSEWTYPAAPGQIGETWAGWTEVALALRLGWKVEVLERLLFPAASGRSGDKIGPLDTWGRRLTAAYMEAGSALVKKALRGILLFGIGSFARSERPRRVLVPRRDVSLLPADNASVRKTASGDFEYWVSDPLPESQRRFQHPEWAADIWARTRTRMLCYQQKKGHGVVVAEWGALAVPRESVIAIRTDALYLACDPGWPDDGRPGAMRVKGRISAPRGMAPPRSFSELNALREKSEKQLDGGGNK